MPGVVAHPSPCSKDSFSISGFKANTQVKPADYLNLPEQKKFLHYTPRVEQALCNTSLILKKKKKEYLPDVTFILLITVRGNKRLLLRPVEKQVLHIKASTVKYLSKCLSPLPWMAEF